MPPSLASQMRNDEFDLTLLSLKAKYWTNVTKHAAWCPEAA